MTFLTTNSTGILRPEQLGPLIVEPLQATSVAMRVSTNVTAISPEYRFPIVTEDPMAYWTPEAQELTESDPGVDELVVRPSKLTALVKVSRELANDSQPAAAEIVGNGIVRQIARQTDLAWGAAATTNGPEGIAGVTGVQTVLVPGGTGGAGGPFVNLDVFIEAESLMNEVGSTATAFIASAATVKYLASLKRFSGTDLNSNEPLLTLNPAAVDPNSGLPKYSINNTPLYWTLEGVIPDGVVWAVDRSKVFVVIREDIELVTSPWPFFTSDSLAVRGIIRLGFGFPHAASVVKIVGALS
jgi:HK97 family phage major capsid protein